jgi:hypothetical protein
MACSMGRILLINSSHLNKTFLLLLLEKQKKYNYSPITSSHYEINCILLNKIFHASENDAHFFKNQIINKNKKP